MLQREPQLQSISQTRLRFVKIINYEIIVGPMPDTVDESFQERQRRDECEPS